MCIGVAQGFNLDLKPCFIASDWAIHLSKHRKRVAELHVNGKRRERVISASRRIWNLNGPLSNWNRLLELPKTLVDRRQNVKAHLQVQTRLAVIFTGAPLEWLQSLERIVESLVRSLIRGDSVVHELEEEQVGIQVVKSHFWVWVIGWRCSQREFGLR